MKSLTFLFLSFIFQTAISLAAPHAVVIREEAFGKIPQDGEGGWKVTHSSRGKLEGVAADLGLVMNRAANDPVWFETKLPAACDGIIAAVYQDPKDEALEYGPGIALVSSEGDLLKVNRRKGGRIGIRTKSADLSFTPDTAIKGKTSLIDVSWNDEGIVVAIGNDEPVFRLPRSEMGDGPLFLRLGKMSADGASDALDPPGNPGFSRISWVKFLGPEGSAPAVKSSPNVRPPLEREGWALTWHDEFDGTSVNPEKWAVFEPGKRESAIVAQANTTVDGKGNLVITTTEVDGVIHTGMISTRRKFDQVFGRWEARIKFQERQGHHGAFWLMPERQNKEPGYDPRITGSEIDIVEWFGADYWKDGGGTACNLYWKDAGGKQAHQGSMFNTRAVIGIDSRVCDDFHVFAVEWDHEEYVFYMNDVEVFRTREGVSHQPQYAILSLLCADWEEPKLNRSKLPESMLVDYVRVYRKAGAGAVR